MKNTTKYVEYYEHHNLLVILKKLVTHISYKPYEYICTIHCICNFDSMLNTNFQLM